MNAFKTIAVLAALCGGPATAQGFDASGNWSCSVTLFQQGLQPYGYQADLSVNADGSLYGRGAVYNPNLQESVLAFEGQGDWIAGPMNGGMWVRLRVHTNGKYGILVFEGPPTGPGMIYLRTRTDDGAQVEAQCTKTA